MNGASRAVVRTVLNERCEAYAVLEGTSFGSDYSLLGLFLESQEKEILRAHFSSTYLVPPIPSLQEDR